MARVAARCAPVVPLSSQVGAWESMSKKPKVNVLPIEQGATPDPQNANKHTARGGALLENSLQRRGAFRSIASAGKGVDVPVVYAGNYTLEKAAAAGFKEIVNVHVTGDQLVNVVRDDIAPHTAEAIALGLDDNEIGKQSYSPDIDLIASLAAGDSAILSALKNEDKMFGGMLDDALNAPLVLSDSDAFSALPDGDRAPFQQMTFTLHDAQAEVVIEAVKLSKGLGEFSETGNENSNGNALARICEMFVGEHDGNR